MSAVTIAPYMDNLWETRSHIFIIFATGESTFEALSRLAGALAIRNVDHQVIDLTYAVDDEGVVTVGAVIEEPLENLVPMAAQA